MFLVYKTQPRSEAHVHYSRKYRCAINFGTFLTQDSAIENHCRYLSFQIYHLCCYLDVVFEPFFIFKIVFQKKTMKTIYITFLSLNINAPSISGRFWLRIVPRGIILDICYSKYIMLAASLMLYQSPFLIFKNVFLEKRP